ncbi:gliding motility-associated ABC transporter substrate-binding protein GldG [Litoribacter alkaliphilus]|uniref:Gliding motility-associated ABC transporter substrate-binding protein GldG n=1 Tax=Litoribacter ruber TaxID=702568 RepID=A0AAP2CG28_9BACT|nr:gliding motility-associated ABC transporter substrate-binding protein GldG [Litoribacter alkaliphilus]MBS9523968.1 gliding motility-associated ABC transporter substrate-binding protein GldG [Litoribacter alkaliphilus]
MRNTNKSILKSIGILAGLLVLFFILESLFPFRIDLTEDKEYSLHPATKETLKELDEPLEVEIVLTGKLPGGMRRLQLAIEETIRTFNAYSSHRITYHYQDPLEIEGEEQRDFIYSLSEYGISPTNLHATVDGGQSSRLIFPGVVIRDSEFETGVLLLRGERGMGPEEILNLSIENLEYELINGIKKLITKQQYAVGMVMDHGELDDDDGFGMVEALVEDYEVYKVPLADATSVEDILGFDVMLVAGPKQAYSERSKYLLDQYLMRGGNIIFLLDQMQVDLTEAGGGGTTALPMESNLDDLLFRYGVRVNRDLIQDLSFGYHPVMTGQFGDQPQITPLPWPFYVVAGRMENHPITKGLDQVQFQFISSIDTVKAEGVTKTPLIFSSDNSRVMAFPVRVAFEDMAQEPEVERFNERHLPLAYLLEGNFTSFYKNRFLPDGANKEEFIEEGSQGKVVVIGDSQVFKSDFDLNSREPVPLGMDPFTGSEYANRLFLQNMVSYLIEPDGIIATRTKQFQIRPLNKVKIRNQKTFWQVMNIGGPVLLICLIGLVKVYLRKKQYG